jgi:DNA-binding NtrC family response regulator
MMSLQRLSLQDRRFFERVNQAVFANPFSDERIQIELVISGLPEGNPKTERVLKTTQRVSQKIREFERSGKQKMQDFRPEDRKLIKYAFLFDFFYRFRKKFDRLILDQIQAGDTPLKTPFAPEALSILEQRGFHAEERLRYFSIAYQVRRAFFFIDRHLIGCSPAMQKLRLNLWNNVFTHNLDLYDRYLWNRMEDFSTLILGETGTGKGTAAQAIGRSGFIPFDEKKQAFVESFTHSFVSLNLSQFPETLIESELFGHKKGAFTGAVEDYEGVFDRCSPHGAILLDEIGEVSIPVQIKLLQVLEERIFSPVGSHKKGRFQGRVIAATNRKTDEILDKNIFRSDFYYRLCTDIIIVPPLRERIQENPQELDDLLAHAVERMAGTPSKELTAMVKTCIKDQLPSNYPWPGNVRELGQCVRRVLLKKSYTGHRAFSATETAFNTMNPENLTSKLIHSMTQGNLNAQGLLSEYCRLLYRQHGTFEAVARLTCLDRRTVKKYIQNEPQKTKKKSLA